MGAKKGTRVRGSPDKVFTILITNTLPVFAGRHHVLAFYNTALRLSMSHNGVPQGSKGGSEIDEIV